MKPGEKKTRDELLVELIEFRKMERTTITKDARQLPLLIHGNTLRDDRVEIIGHMAFITDMTAQKKALALASEVHKSLMPQENPQIPGLPVQPYS